MSVLTWDQLLDWVEYHKHTGEVEPDLDLKSSLKLKKALGDSVPPSEFKKLRQEAIDRGKDNLNSSHQGSGGRQGIA